ncbi:MAG: hypothetical protein JRL30_01300 [Deltaproteobacteria bacterium]|nr:hypothetical protein [Deltaproteobacteria bacterium]
MSFLPKDIVVAHLLDWRAKCPKCGSYEVTMTGYSSQSKLAVGIAKCLCSRCEERWELELPFQLPTRFVFPAMTGREKRPSYFGGRFDPDKLMPYKPWPDNKGDVPYDKGSEGVRICAGSRYFQAGWRTRNVVG